MNKCMQCLTEMEWCEIEVPERGLMIKRPALWCPSCQTYYYQITSDSSNE